jgi:hypothetical protein
MSGSKWNEKSIEFQTRLNRSRIHGIVKLAEDVNLDPKLASRLSIQECRFCFYNRGKRICGQGFTYYNCGNCEETNIYANTCIPKLCNECAKELSCCHACGAKID